MKKRYVSIAIALLVVITSMTLVYAYKNRHSIVKSNQVVSEKPEDWCKTHTCKTGEEPKKPELPLLTRERMLEAVNKARADKGIAPVALDDRLNASAQAKADDMKVRDYYSHIDPDGKAGTHFIREYAPNVCNLASENISTAREVPTMGAFESWMASPPHRQAILDARYSYIGVGYTGGYAVLHFCQTY